MSTLTLPWGDELPDILLHVNSADALSGISRLGLAAGAQWSNADVAAYLARRIEDAGYAPIILSLPRAVLDAFQPRPDWEALETPPLEVVMRDTQALSHYWTQGEPTPDRSLGLVGSIRTDRFVPASVLHAHLPHLREQASQARHLQRKTALKHRRNR